MNIKYLLLVSGLISVVFSALAASIPLGLYNQGEVSAMFPTLFTPATFTFSIWIVIYLSWIALGIWQALGKIEIRRENAILLASAQILSSLWLIPSQFLFTGTSLIVILGVLYFLMILLYESRNETTIFTIVSDAFLGWIIVASIANLHLVLVSYSIYLFPLECTLISILLGLAVNIYFIVKLRSYAPAIVLIWAVIGIIFGQANIIVQIASFVSLIIILGVLFYKHPLLKK